MSEVGFYMGPNNQDITEQLQKKIDVKDELITLYRKNINELEQSNGELIYKNKQLEKEAREFKAEIIDLKKQIDEISQALIDKADQDASDPNMYETKRAYFQGISQGLDTFRHSIGLKDDFDREMEGGKQPCICENATVLYGAKSRCAQCGKVRGEHAN